ncbi:MAG: O-acetyl-ADP-ribose deacetylase [Halofilum sp. (in: g-proteobacteria)]|nr:O-acetyl-ADP-ribose deacetylase [Halofilum sp. (in: g-proteobacteria)]
MRFRRGDRVLEIRRGDITQQDVDAVVNAANARLAPGGGVAGAIHRAAGPELWEACRPLGGCATGEAKLTDGFALPARWIVHTVGPVYGQDEPSATLLAASYRNSLAVADEAGATSIAFPALSTGAFGYPLEDAAEVAIGTLLEALPQRQNLREARMVLFGEHDQQVHDAVLARLGPEQGWSDDS